MTQRTTAPMPMFFRPVEVDVNLSLAGTASAESSYAGYTPAKVNDGDNSTASESPDYSWASASGAPAWWEIDFGSSKTFKRIELYTPASYVCSVYTIKYWDGADWVTIVEVTGNTEAHRTHLFSAKTSQKVRVYCAKPGDYNRLCEVEVHTTGDNIAISQISPSSGTPDGGTSVTITGFGFTSASSVKFGTTEAASFTVDSDTQITAVSPAHSAGAVDISVVSPSGTSDNTTADDYTFADLAQYSVSGAGDANENGTYVQVADINGKMGLMNENGWYMYYDGYGSWMTSDSQPYGMPYHMVSSEADTPPTTGWSAMFGSGEITVTQL